MNEKELYQLGMKYWEEGNCKEAYKCFLQLSLDANPDGCFALANMYLISHYPNIDYENAFYYYKLAYRYSSNEIFVFNSLYYINQKREEIVNNEKASEAYLDYLNYLIENEVWSACIYLAEEYGYGEIVPKDIDQKMYYFRMAGEHGEEYGYDCLAEMYFIGNEVEKDYQWAHAFFEKSTGSTSNIKPYYYGEMYRIGLIFEKDIEKSKEYYRSIVDDKREYRDMYSSIAKSRLKELEGKENEFLD